MEKYYKIADLIVKMDTFGIVEHSAIPYLIEKPLCCVDIEVEADRELVRKKTPNMQEEYREILATYRSFFVKLIEFDGIYIHSSVIIANDKAYLFTADSGTGKSTHTKIWRRVFGDANVRILNDDKAALRLIDGKWYAYGTPWSGKSDVNLNLKVPLGAICILTRGKENSIRKVDPKDAIFALYKQTARPKDPALREKILEMLDKLLTKIPIWCLACNMEPEAAIVAYEAMSGQKWRNENET